MGGALATAPTCRPARMWVEMTATGSAVTVVLLMLSLPLPPPAACITGKYRFVCNFHIDGCGSGAYVRAQRHICLAVNIDRHDSCAPLLRSTSRSQSTGKACETMACWVGSRCCCCLHGPQAGRQLT